MNSWSCQCCTCGQAACTQQWCLLFPCLILKMRYVTMNLHIFPSLIYFLNWRSVVSYHWTVKIRLRSKYVVVNIDQRNFMVSWHSDSVRALTPAVEIFYVLVANSSECLQYSGQRWRWCGRDFYIYTLCGRLNFTLISSWLAYVSGPDCSGMQFWLFCFYTLFWFQSIPIAIQLP